MTKTQFRLRTKDVTRRNGWWNAEAGEHLQGCEQCQGLGPGGKIVRMGTIVLVSATPEPLRRLIDEPDYGRAEVIREGFPEMTPYAFMVFWIKGHKGTTPDSTVNRLEYRYLD